MMRLFVPMDLAWLKEQLRLHGRSQSALARYMGIEHAAVVNRIVNGSRRIKVEEAEQIEAYLRATDGSTWTGKGDNQTQPENPTHGLTLIPVLGVVEAGAWREVADVALAERETIEVAQDRRFEGETFALKVVGASMNRVYPDGSFVIARRWNGGPLPAGKRVIVDRERDGLHETTIKELVRTSDGHWELWPRSDDPRHQQPIPYEDENTTVRIIGRVIARLGFED